MTEIGISVSNVEKILAVLAQHPLVDRAILYGSRAKGTHRRGSDIDLTLDGAGLGLADLGSIADELDDLLLPYTIDLSLLHLIEHKDLRAHIERVGVEFYRRQPTPPTI